MHLTSVERGIAQGRLFRTVLRGREKQFDRIQVLRLTRHKIGHFGDVLPSQSLG